MVFEANRGTIKPVFRPEKFEYAMKTVSRQRNSLVALCCVIFAMTFALPSMALSTTQSKDDYVRANFTAEDGLPDNVVNAIVQTGNGLLWVGTESGLASFDGREFTPIDLHIPGSPSEGSVNALVAALNGDLWIGTNAGVVLMPSCVLSQFDPARITYYQLGAGGTDEVQSLYQSRDGVLWAGTNHGLYRLESGRFVPVIAGLFVIRLARR